MRSRWRLVVELVAVISLAMSQAVAVLHGVTHDRHHDEQSASHAFVADAHDHDGEVGHDDGDHELLHSSTPANPSFGKSLLPTVVLVAQLAFPELTERLAVPQSRARPQPRPYVASPPDQPRAPPVG